MYLTFKFLHILGAILLIGNVTATAVWKVFADRTGNATNIAFAQRLVIVTDWSLTLSGIVLIVVGGYGMVLSAGLDPWSGWLMWGQLMFVASGLIWAAVLLPLQSRMARSTEAAGSIGEAYWSMSRRWIVWGVAATVPLVVATFLMVFKP